MILLMFALACHRGEDPDSGPGPERAPLSPFPNSWLMSNGHLALPEDTFPMVEGGTPIDVARLNTRTGFSPVQTTVVDLGVALDATSLPYGDAASPGEGPVQIWDLDTGLPVRAFGELDAGAEGSGEDAVLLVRPMEPMADGHEIAVVITDALRAADGEPAPSPDWFVAAAAGRAGDHLAAEAASTPALLDRLADLGVSQPILAVSFPIDAGEELLDDVLADVSIPTNWTWTSTLSSDAGDTLPERTYKQLEGTFLADQWITAEGVLDLSGGAPAFQGQGDVDLLVHIPESARGAEPGTVPVWIFGHGIFGDPGVYLSDLDDPSAVVAVADAAGAILLATRWTGLTRTDLGTVLSVANDFGRFPEISDPLVQAQANQEALVRLILEGELLDDPVFEGLPARDQLFYYGISLGGIEGAVLLAHEPRIEHAVLHAGGSAWSFMLERSFAWESLAPLVEATVPSAHDRQILFALSQLYWDPVEPANVASKLSDRSILWQECLGDDMVPNLSTELLMRGVGAPLLSPDIEAPSGIEQVEGPTVGPAFFQYDPELGRPDPTNTPSPHTEAHTIPRTWASTQAQTVRFLDADDPGVAVAPCGEAPCTAENTGL